MEEKSEINLKENQKRVNYFSKSNELRKRERRKNKTLFNQAKSIIRNKFIKPASKNIINNVNIKIKKERNPGIDLVRLLTMYLIVVFHFMIFGNAYNYFYIHQRKLRLIQSFIEWHNDAFILISGIVGYKTNKYSNLLYLWLMVVFYNLAVHKYAITYKKNFHVNPNINGLYYPVVYKSYWYFTTYFGMYLFLPVINKGIAQLTRYEFRLVVMSTLGILIVWKDYKNKRNDIFRIGDGHSVIWFLIFYLTGAYIGKYRVDYKGIKKYIYCIICAVIFIFTSFLYFKLIIGEFYFLIGNNKIEIPIFFRTTFSESYNSLLKIIQSITVCLFFLQIHYNKYIAKIICFFGPLAFSIYLIYSNEIFLVNVMKKLFVNQSRNISFNTLLSLLLKESLKICITSLIIDYFRHLLFTVLRIKNILLFIETKMKEKFSK